MVNESSTFTFNPAGAGGDTTIKPRPSEVRLKREEIYDTATPDYEKLGQRNKAQQDNIRKLEAKYPSRLLKSVYDDSEPSKTLQKMFGQSLDWTYRCYSVEPKNIHDLAGQPLFQEYIYLFNVMVAFEWHPSEHNVAMLERAARRAADFLFVVTDGWMTFGQVIIGGPELLNCADYQVLASNRLLPRSWVGGLHEETKYMPIRLGRGFWQKNSRGSIPWDEPEGYRVLIHEWAHYALELLDDYVDTHQVYIRDDVKATQGFNEARRSNRNLAVPSISPPVESIMSTLEGTSELTAKKGNNLTKRKQAEWEVIIEGFDGRKGKKPRFPRIKKPIKPIRGPMSLRELPHIAHLILSENDPKWKDELLLPVASISPSVQLEHCWVYILKSLNERGIPNRILAQGTLDARLEDGFRLFGAEEGDDIMLTGDGPAWREKVLRAKIAAPVDVGQGRSKITNIHWADFTPNALPIIDVMPEQIDALPERNEVALPDDRTGRIRVCVYHPDTMAPYGDEADIYIFPLDQVNSSDDKGFDPIYLKVGEATPDRVSLDGHVLIKLPDDKFVIATYSQGGGPPTGSPTGGTPMTPGSAEGNLMIFFTNQGEYPNGNVHHSAIRIVTTRWPGGALNHLPSGADARSYTYSLCSNEALPSEYQPTLSLFYDKRTELQDGEAVIHRQDDNGIWQPITSYRPGGAWYVASPLDHNTAPRLVDPDPPKNGLRVERYRLYLIPHR